MKRCWNRLFSLATAGIMIWLALWGAPHTASASAFMDGQPKGTIAGRVTDSAGQPVPNAALSYQELTGRADDIAAGKTDGSFSLQLPTGTYQLTAAAPGHLSSSQVIVVTAGGQATTAFRLASAPATGAIAGKVTQSDSGQAVPNLDVRVYSGDWLAIPVAFTGADGSYSLQGLAPGKYWVTFAESLAAGGAAYAFAERYIAVTADATLPLDVQVERFGFLTAKVVTASGDPAPDAAVVLTLYRKGNSNSIPYQADATGHVTIPVPPGHFSVRAGGAAYMDSPTQYSAVAPASTTGVTLKVGTLPTGTLTGRVTDTKGVPLAHAKVLYYMTTPGSFPYLHVLTDANGRYRIGRIAAGGYSVIPLADGYSAVGPAKAVTITAGLTSQADLQMQQTALVPVKIVDAVGKPVPGATLVSNAYPLLTAATDTNGNFLTPVDEVSTQVSAEAPGYRRTASKEIKPGGPVTTFTLEPAKAEDYGTVVGHAINLTTGMPIAGAPVQLRYSFGSGSPVLAAPTASDGSFTFNQVPPGTYNVWVDALGDMVDMPAFTVMAGMTTNAAVTVTERANLEVHVVDRQGQPVPYAEIQTTEPSIRAGGPPIAFSDTADQHGMAVIGVEAETQVTVSATAPPLTCKPQSITLKGHGYATLTLTLEPVPPAAVKGYVLTEAEAPAPGISVQLYDANTRKPVGAPVVTDQSGAFSFPKVEVGNWQVRVVNTPDDIGIDVAPAKVAAGQTVTVQLKVRHIPQLTDMVGQWANDDVRKLQARGILSGYPDNTFHPEANLTRYEVAKAVVALLGRDPAKANLTLLDKLADAGSIPTWARPYVALTLASTYMPSDATGFHGYDLVTRAGMAEIIGHLLPPVPKAADLPFSDVAGLSGNTKMYVGRTVYYQVITGFPDGTFRPGDLLTRAQMARILVRFLEVH